MVMISLRYIPLFLQEVERITRAQRARGRDFDRGGFFQRVKRGIPLLIPLFASSLRRTHGIADALVVRGYGEGARWPARERERVGRAGYLSLVATGGIIGLVMSLGFLRGFP
jgi:energy-coupling factor transport system permease protein